MADVHLHIHFHGESDRAGLEFARQTAQDWLGRIRALQAEIDGILSRQPATDAPAAQEAGTSTEEAGLDLRSALRNASHSQQAVAVPGDPDEEARPEPGDPRERAAALAKLREIKAQVGGKKGRPSKRPTCVICGKPVSYGSTACQKHIKAARKLREQEAAKQRREQETEKKRQELLRAYDEADETGPEEIEMDDGDPDPDEEIEAPDEEEDGDDEEVI